MCNRYQAREKRVNYVIITFGFAVCFEVMRKDAQRKRKQFFQSRSIDNRSTSVRVQLTWISFFRTVEVKVN